MNVTRRDILRLAGGSALGIVFSPLPWKLLDDSAIWTQNWSLIPPLPRGPVSFKHSTCTLCSAGCAIKARCVSNVPVSLSGVQRHPISQGVLCPIGIAGHHLAYHPLRIAQPMKFESAASDSKLRPISYDEAVAQISKAIIFAESGGESVAILDQRPGRATSDVYRAFLNALPNGAYLIPPSRECTTVTRLQEMMGVGGEFGLDFENTRTVLSFGAPLLDGWGTPGRMIHAFSERKATGRRLIQIENHQSRTALQADHWLPVKPGSEAALALGIANVIVAEGLYHRSVERSALDFAAYKGTVAAFGTDAVAGVTGLNPQDIITTARELAHNAPSIVIAGCDPGGGPLGKSTENAIAGLNLLLGNVGRKGGIVARQEIPGSRNFDVVPHQLAEVPDHSIRVLIIDGAESGYTLPWKLVQQKLVPGSAIVVSLSPYLGGFAAHSDFLIPSPAHLESFQEVPSPTNSRTSTYSISQPLLPMREGSRDPLDFINKLAEAAGVTVLPSSNGLLKERVNAINASRRGSVFSSSDGNIKRMTDLANVDDLWTTLVNGGVWIDDDSDQKPPRSFRLLGTSDEERKRIVMAAKQTTSPLVLVPVGWRGAIEGAHISPVMSKVFQESELRGLASSASINHETGIARNLTDGERVMLTTQNGAMEVIVHLDSSVMPGVVQASVGPQPNGHTTVSRADNDGILTLCSLTDESTWRVTPVTMEKV